MRHRPRHGGQEGDVGVAPDVDHVVPRVGGALKLQLIILQHWQQLHCIDAQLLQVGDLGRCGQNMSSGESKLSRATDVKPPR